MGIKGLNKIIAKYAPEAVTHENITNFRGSKIAIDSELLLHKFRTSNNVPNIFADSMDVNNSHIYGFLINIFWYMNNGIVPLYVFDGSPNEAKQNNAIHKRSLFREQMVKKADEIKKDMINHKDYNSDNGEALSEEFNVMYDRLQKLEKKMTCMNVSWSHRKECKYLLKLLGIPYVVANEDAEAYCVILQQKGYVDYVYTEDTDAIPYCVSNMNADRSAPLRIFKTTNYSKNPYYLNNNFTANRVNKYDIITIVDVDVLMEKLGMSNESFIDMCIMCGCDFCPAYPKITYDKAYEAMKKYEIIENYLGSGNLAYPEFKYKEARKIFYVSHDVKLEKEVSYGELNSEDLKRYLKDERCIHPSMIDNIINKYKKSIKEYENIVSESSDKEDK